MTDRTLWLVIITLGSRQYEVTPNRDTREAARHIAANYRRQGIGAFVVKRHEWETA